MVDVPAREVKRGNGKFCSLKCSSAYQQSCRPKPNPNVKCAMCDKEFYLTKSRTVKSKSGLHFCCRECKDKAQRISGISAILPTHYNSANDYRTLAIQKYGLKCSSCGYEDHPAAITVHHKDRDRKNNSLDNLEVLCQNCHCIKHWGGSIANERLLRRLAC
jgi:hypothetical protein